MRKSRKTLKASCQQATLRLRKNGSALGEQGLGSPLASAVDYVMTTAQAAVIVGLTRPSSAATAFVVPKNTTSRRLLESEDWGVTASERDAPFLQLNDHLQRQSFAGVPEGGPVVFEHASRRSLAQRSNNVAPAPSADYSILDAVVQMTVRSSLLSATLQG